MAAGAAWASLRRASAASGRAARGIRSWPQKGRLVAGSTENTTVPNTDGGAVAQGAVRSDGMSVKFFDTAIMDRTVADALRVNEFPFLA